MFASFTNEDHVRQGQSRSVEHVEIIGGVQAPLLQWRPRHVRNDRNTHALAERSWDKVGQAMQLKASEWRGERLMFTNGLPHPAARFRQGFQKCENHRSR